MIVVSVQLWSAVDGEKTELARMVIANDGTTTVRNPRLGSYRGWTYKGRDAQALSRQTIAKTGLVENWRRQDFHIWNLVARMLESMGYDKGRAAALAAKADA